MISCSGVLSMNTLSVRKGPVQRPTPIGRWGQRDRAQGRLIDLDNKANDEKDEARMHILVEGLPICISVRKRQPCSKQFTYERILSNVLENVVDARQRSEPDQSEIIDIGCWGRGRPKAWMAESRSTPQDRREVRSHGEQPTRSQADWAIRLTRSQVLYEEQPTRSQAATWRKLGSYTSSAINQPTLFGVHPQNQTQTLTVDGTLSIPIHPHLTPTLNGAHFSSSKTSRRPQLDFALAET